MNRTKWLIATVVFAAASVFAAGQASAHHALLTPAVTRPCGQQAPWSGTVTVRSDDPQRGKHWQLQVSVGGGLSYTQAPSGRVLESTQFQIAIPSIPANVSSVTVSVRASWYRYSGSSNPDVVDSWRQVTLHRPSAWSCPTTTTTSTTTTSTTTTTTPTTTTAPSTTTTTAPSTTTTTEPTTTTAPTPRPPGAPVPVVADPSFTG